MMKNTSGAAKSLFEPSFLIAVAVLATAAFGVGPRLLGNSGPKLPVPLKKSLGLLDKESVGQYRFRTQHPLNPAVAEVLGTKEFIDWTFEDSSVEDRKDPRRYVRLTVSYYTGGRDLVPHTPDQCMIGAGYTAKVAENLDLQIPSLDRSIPVRVLSFEKGAIMNHENPTVAYMFVCNGDFVCTRNDVRLRMNSFADRHAYFAKIEVSFGSAQSTPNAAPRDESIAATERFLDQLLPVLLRDHLPDWDAVIQQEKAEHADAK